uniref:Copine C-terminal domain-containing protein n=1 Tax=Parascaris equorum TaxID=6256 RepID=A0A914RXP0_PAREQ
MCVYLFSYMPSSTDSYQLAYRTRYHEQNLNPKWKPFEIHINQLCYGDKDRTELEFTVAVDFTKSNLPTDDSSSLHHVDEENANQYEIAIRAIAEICQYYNRSQIFHAYGFGARLPGDNLVRYNFPLVCFFPRLFQKHLVKIVMWHMCCQSR